MMRRADILGLAFALVLAARFPSSGGAETPPAGPPLDRGVCIDRQIRSIPPAPEMTLHQDDMRLIRSLGFEFVKLIFNPAVLQRDDGLDPDGAVYLDHVVNMAMKERLAVVVCIHPEPEFKRAVLVDSDAFLRFERFMEVLSRHMARRWTHRRLAFQLMTEPFGTSEDPRDWNHWDRLQRRLWRVARRAMPQHTLILSGDMVGAIEGLYNIRAVNDDKALYSFTFYDPGLFTQQGGGWLPDGMPYLKNLPYPSGPETLARLPGILDAAPPEWRAEIRTRVQNYAAQRWDRQVLASRIEKAVEWARRQDRPVRLWCAEFGCYEAAPPEDRLRYLEEVRSLLEEHRIGWAYWSYNETFTVMAPGRTPFGPAARQTPDRALLKALMPEQGRGKGRGSSGSPLVEGNRS